MNRITLDLGNILRENETYATTGISPGVLKSYTREYLLPSGQIVEITLDNTKKMEFIIHNSDDRKQIVTSLSSLSSSCPEGISLDLLPEILVKLHKQGVTFTMLQFPHAFMVKGRLTGVVYRAHFNHIVICKDGSGEVNVSLVDSSSNPVGVYQPLSRFFGAVSTSIVSGKPLFNVVLRDLVAKPDVVHLLQTMCSLEAEAKISVTDPIMTGKQSSIDGDKRCGLYTLSAMAALINLVTSGQPVTMEAITMAATTAHQQLNDTDMRQISFPGASAPSASA